MEIDWSQILLGFVTGGGFVGLVTTYYQLRQERIERARARFREIVLTKDFLELLGHISHMAWALKKYETTQADFTKTAEQFAEVVRRPMNGAVLWFLGPEIRQRVTSVLDLLDTRAPAESVRREAKLLSDDLRNMLGFGVLE
jgi:hypothetical protein